LKSQSSRWIEREGYRKRILSSEEELGEGNIVQIVEITPGSEVKPHYHKVQTEFFYILEGKSKLSIGGIEYNASEGDYYLCRPGDVHSVKNDSGSVFKILVFKTNWREGDSYW
jgi:quercetin dioxygenase-like cupin family protein